MDGRNKSSFDAKVQLRCSDYVRVPLAMIVSNIIGKLNNEVMGIRAFFYPLIERNLFVSVPQLIFNPKSNADTNLNIKKLGTDHGGELVWWSNRWGTDRWCRV
jgi:hypothetical protein